MSHKTEQQYSNQAIARFNSIMAHEATAIMGRATGKTYGLHGERLWSNAQEMPRSLIGLVSESYRKMFEYLLPPIIRFLNSKGLEKDKHFFLRSAAPKKWGWKLPYNEVMDYGHFLHLPNGTGAIILSQDHNTTNNGASLDALQIDEVRKLNKNRLAEDLPAMRGNAWRFKDSPMYAGRLYTTDMPGLEDEIWVLDHKNHADPTQNEIIFNLAQMRAYWWVKYVNTKSKHYLKNFNQADAEWRKFRYKSSYYMEADSFENRYILGADWFEIQMKSPDPLSIGPQIFTIQPQKGSNSFFPYLSKTAHTYRGTRNSFLEGMDWNHTSLVPNSNWDEDLDHSVPMELVFDHNASINTLLVCQETGGAFRTQHALFVKDAENKRLEDLVEAFDQYYRNHFNRDILYYYDSTDLKSDNRHLGNSMEDVMKYLGNRGWNVTPIYTGVPSNHVDRYRFFVNWLSGNYRSIPSLQINLDKAEVLYKAMKLTKTKVRTAGKQDFGIDKRAETDPAYPQEYAPHFPEALAKIAVYKYSERAENSSSNSSITVMA